MNTTSSVSRRVLHQSSEGMITVIPLEWFGLIEKFSEALSWKSVNACVAMPKRFQIFNGAYSFRLRFIDARGAFQRNAFQRDESINTCIRLSSASLTLEHHELWLNNDTSRHGCAPFQRNLFSGQENNLDYELVVRKIM